jgi:uncharacterized membrane protein YhhN
VIAALGLAALTLGTIHIVADYRRAWVTTWWSKPATMLAILAVVLLFARPLDEYAALIAAGLVASLIGDVVLMLRPARFLAGLVAFFIAHLIYIAAFAGQVVPGPIGLAVALLAAGAVIYRQLWPGLHGLRLPVLAYVLAILAMVWTAWSVWLARPDAGSAAAAAGALLFLISDTSLGFARFRYRYPGAQAVTLGSYYVGQWLIALSAVWHVPA